MTELWHGTHSGYTYHRCRCETCVRFRRAYMRRYFAEAGPWRTPVWLVKWHPARRCHHDHGVTVSASARTVPADPTPRLRLLGVFRRHEDALAVAVAVRAQVRRQSLSRGDQGP